MPYLIDGHNLVPKIPGLSLQDFDDEQQLIVLLQDFCRLQNKQVEIYFDNAPAGVPARQKYGQVSAYFTRRGLTADEALRARMDRLGAEAANWTVVSSDQAVQSAARQRRAKTMTSEQFARLLANSYQQPKAEPEVHLSPDEVAEWLNLFDKGRN